MYKNVEIGNGLRLTQSDDMGIFLHCSTGKDISGGIRLDNKFPLAFEIWAKFILDKEPESPEASIKFITDKM